MSSKNEEITLQREIREHYVKVEEQEGGGAWYRCKHCDTGPLYYSTTHPSDLVGHIPDELYWTADNRNGCSERLRRERREL